MADEIKLLVKAKSNLVWIEKFCTYCFSNLGTFWILFSSQALLWDETSYVPESLTKADAMVTFIKKIQWEEELYPGFTQQVTY